jgi:filamentous hemagglutinin family protein
MTRIVSPFWVATSIALSYLATISPARAQIVPDNTLPMNSSVTPGCTGCRIDGGTVRGGNLFHSFSEFSVPASGEAFFNNASQIQNILTRVTGNSVSNIDGLLRANGTANLFFLNPNGIIFGARARLNIGGSFVASTASSLVFADGIVFSATPDTLTTPLLSISLPIGLQYGRNPGSVQVRGSYLEVNPGQTLALVGGDMNLNDGQLLGPGGRFELGGVAGTGTVGLNIDGSNLRLSFPDGATRADVSLYNGAEVNVLAGGGGSIAINARNLNVDGASRLLAGIASGKGAVDAKAGDIDFNASGAIQLTNNSVISSVVLDNSVGNGGNVIITTGRLVVRDGAQVSVSSQGEGNAGTLAVRANSISLDNKGQLTVATNSGEGGNINLQLRDLIVMRRNSTISAEASNNGNGGNIVLNAKFIVAVRKEDSDIFAYAQRGSGGNILITTPYIYGLEVNFQRTPLSDITVSSSLGVENTGPIYSTYALVKLPTNLVDQTSQISQSCSTGGRLANRENKFTVTGRSGLPQSPTELISPDMVLDDFGTLATETETRSNATPSTPPNKPPKQLVEAQGWVFGLDGKVILTASAPNATPYRTWQTPANCQVSQTDSQ